MKWSATILFLVSMLPLQAANWLFKDGKSEYVIVIAPAASVSEQTAAAELRDYLKQISGATLPVVHNLNARGKHIYVGFNDKVSALTGAAAPPDTAESFTYRTIGDDLLIYGGRNRGTMYGVYAFLERELGVMWLTSAYTRVPKQMRFALGRLNRCDGPVIRRRLDFYYEALRHYDWTAHNLLNTQYLLASTPYGEMSAYWGMHTFEVLIPPSRYFKSYPEFFSVKDGKRSDKAQLCLSNAKMRRELTKNLKETIAQNPGYWGYDVSQNDNGFPCECKNCRKLVEKYGGQSGAMLWFVNQVAADVKKVYPDIYVGTFAYWYTRQASVGNIKAADNVVVRLCDIECCMAHPLEGCSQNRSFLNDMNNWRKRAKNIYIWDYTTGFSNYLLPFPNFDVLAANFRYFSRSNVIGILEEGAHNTPWAEFSELKQWVIAKLLWNPYQNTDSLSRLFINNYYGKAAPYVWQYYNLCRKQVAENVHFTISVDWNSALYSDKFVSDGLALMLKAQKAVGKDAEMLKRTRRITAQLYYLKLRRNTVKAATDNTLSAFKEIIRSDNALIRENNYTLDDLLKDLHYY